jgi:hypothetical protein
MEVTFQEIKEELKKGCRVLMLTRHAERKKINHEDPTFGESLPITDEGISTSIKFGEAFKDYTGDVQFIASPLKRTQMTAEYIAKGMGISNPIIPTCELLGNGTFYFADAYRVFEIFRDGSFFEKIFQYFESGKQEGFHPLLDASNNLENWALENFKAKLGFFTTHDLYIGAFLHARGVKTDFTVETWLRFLDSAAIIIEPSGTKRYALVRAGLSEHVMGIR